MPASIFDFTLKVICPPEFTVPTNILVAAQKNKARVSVTHDIVAAEGADVVVTDCWVSMHNSDAAARQERLGTVPSEMQASCAKHHPTPSSCIACRHIAVRKSPDEVLDSPQAVVWDEAENRMHAQKAVICWCLNKMGG